MSRAKSAENKKKPARVAEGPEAPGFARSLGESTGHIVRPMIPLMIFLAVLVAVSMALWYPVNGDSFGLTGIPNTVPAQRGRLNARTLRSAILEKQRPAWIYKEDYEQVASLAQCAASHSVFEAQLGRQIAHKLEASPWVERVQAVRLRYPAQVEIDVDWRRPVASVPQSNLVLDRHGVVLNLAWNGAAAKDIPRISSVACSRIEPGKQVPEKEVRDALALLAVVKDALFLSPGNPKNLKVAEVVREASGMWHIVTDRGPVIYWGAFTEDPPLDEPRTQEKAELLRRRLCECKDPGELEYVKVYLPSVPFKPRAASAAVSAAVPAASGRTR